MVKFGQLLVNFFLSLKRFVRKMQPIISNARAFKAFEIGKSDS